MVNPGEGQQTENSTAPASTAPALNEGRSVDARESAALVVVLNGDRPSDGGKVVPLSGVTSVRIGRGKVAPSAVANAGTGARLAIPDARVSSEHASVELVDGRWMVRDLGSRNGTFVRSERISRSVPLLPLMPLLVGHTVLTLVADVHLPDPTMWPFRTANGAFGRELARLSRVAATPLSILLLGETGTGKEVVARAVHERSGRPGPFVAVNCAALPPNLVEAQLFGHVRGAFSGAVRDEPGLFRAANNGTLLLDEIGDLPLPAQAALLRVLQEGEVLAVGATKAHKVDVRVIAATHQALGPRNLEGRFRADLFARIAGFVGNLPPLRKRREDLGFLVAAFLARENIQARLRPEVVSALYAHDFPMNVRELMQTLSAALALADDGEVRAEHLPAHFSEAAPVQEEEAPEQLDAESAALRAELLTRLQAANGNVSRVARDMGKARQQIQRWMRRFGLRG